MIPNTQPCRLCGNETGNKRLSVREMMFGSKEVFEYLECANCGSLSLVSLPPDLSKYYPEGYYSFKNKARMHYPLWMRVLKHARARHALTGRGILGGLLNRYKGHWSYFTKFKAAGIRFNSSILDVGCGNGDYLLRFSSDGFKNLSGVDPFIEKEIRYPNGVTIYKKNLHEMQGQFDCVLALHSFEHMIDPVGSLNAINALIKPGGVALIAIPIAGSAAWTEYGANWYQIDAPRHIAIPSPKAMEMLAKKMGMVLEKTIFDSTDDHFLVCEAYKRDISLTRLQNEGADHFFTAEERNSLRESAKQANAADRGDQACFILRKPL